MRLTICFTMAILCAVSAGAKPAAHVARQLNETTWAYVEDGKHLRMSIDAHGNYIEKTVGGKLMGHGTAVMKGAKDCFTPFMSEDGEHCWTSKPLEIGQSMVSVSDKGERLKVTRITYIPLSMPKETRLSSPVMTPGRRSLHPSLLTIPFPHTPGIRSPALHLRQAR